MTCTLVNMQYANAHAWYKNLDKLMHYANSDGRLNVLYSSPESYVAAKNSYRGAWPLKTDDFFPYADCQHCYWTGMHNRSINPISQHSSIFDLEPPERSLNALRCFVASPATCTLGRCEFVADAAHQLLYRHLRSLQAGILMLFATITFATLCTSAACWTILLLMQSQATLAAWRPPRDSH